VATLQGVVDGLENDLTEARAAAAAAAAGLACAREGEMAAREEVGAMRAAAEGAEEGLRGASRAIEDLQNKVHTHPLLTPPVAHQPGTTSRLSLVSLSHTTPAPPCVW